MARPAKRQRTGDASKTRSEIWHKDGSVVLQAESIQFRVHWSVLAMHSSFFRDMQDLHQPPDQESIDGCPVVEMQDAVVDVEHLLRVLYNPTLLLQKALPLPVIAALIRLGRKYDFRDLLDAGVERLAFEHPTTLEGYDALSNDGTYNTTRIVQYRGIIYDIIALARENNIFSVLPCAYYRALIYHTPEQLFDGVLKTDGTVASLAPVDQRRCVLSRIKLLKAQTEPGHTIGWLRSPPSNACTTPENCTKARNSKLGKYMSGLYLCALSQYSEQRSTCGPCRQHNEEMTVAGRKKMWEALPGFFDLPPWGQLKNDL
ncbi:hypothetical protein C8R44DRAFT_782342 [Mycena epipterygia]|nr:hypothetical protein C8R44DRAFT_782342 [Mycena epipterygia]